MARLEAADLQAVSDRFKAITREHLGLGLLLLSLYFMAGMLAASAHLRRIDVKIDAICARVECETGEPHG